MTVGTAEENPNDRRMALALEWDELVAQVRKLDGFKDFLRPPAVEDLLPAAERGPVVVINASRWRCDALIVRPDGVHPVPLPALTLEETARRANDYLDKLRAVEAADAALIDAQNALGAESGREAIRRERTATQEVDRTQTAVDEMLADLQVWMWDTIAAPVLAELGFDQTPPGGTSTWPRLWWCPTGALTVLPIHTAGYHSDPADQRRTVLDRVVSSYTPTLRALLDARDPGRRKPTPAGETDRLLLVSVGKAEGQIPLETGRERDVLLELFPGDLCTDLNEDDATRERVRQALGAHRWVHFSCHGDQDLRDPSQGGVWLHDGMLTIDDLTTEQFDGDFAGLSACKTAMGGIDLLDEAITLAAALHYLGYRHVVATLWSVTNDHSSEIFTGIYQRMAADGQLRPDVAAVALHDAVRTLRDRDPGYPHRWTPFTHTGP
ncbi:hypothetical protein GCM10022235_00290 [Kribbella ginsengisoli]|uniref:CHAT domain-containing protein n=2 Tax=Kribbella ginsengisoli TaxID=363865 RepID=A0ABP6VJV8_9ACTN